MFEKKILKGKTKETRGIFLGFFVLLIGLLATGCSVGSSYTWEGADTAGSVPGEDQWYIDPPLNLLSSTSRTEIHYVFTAEELEAINGGVAGYEDWGPDDSYILLADIDLSGYSSWTPIGENVAAPFTGEFDGHGYTITGLTIDRPNNNYTGLFGRTENCVIKNLTIEVCSIMGGAVATGGIAGYTYNSTIENCSVSGIIRGNFFVGGLIGYIDSDATIQNCFSSVQIAGNQNLSCLIGGGAMNNCEISNSYAKGSIEGDTRLGGILGLAIGQPVTLTNCYAGSTISRTTGNIYSTIGIGGLIGDNTGYTKTDENIPILTNCYYDIQTTPAAEPVNDLGTKVTSEQMKQQATFSGWDFASIWDIDPNKNEGNPFLKSTTPF